MINNITIATDHANSPQHVENHSPTSSSSQSDKENLALGSQRVRSIVREFDKIADECDSFAKRQSFTHRDTTTQSAQFQRQCFQNASLHATLLTLQSPAIASQQVTSQSIGGFLLKRAHPFAKSGKPDSLIALQTACAQNDTEPDANIEDPIALQAHRADLHKRWINLLKLRKDATAMIGGKRTAIIDKTVRQCLNDADRKLEFMRQKINELDSRLESHRRFERLHQELDHWTIDVLRSIQSINNDGSVKESRLNPFKASMQNERANFDELHLLAATLGAEQQRQQQVVAKRWSQAEQILHFLQCKTESARANKKLSEAIGQLDNFLNATHDLSPTDELYQNLDRVDEFELFCQSRQKLEHFDTIANKESMKEPGMIYNELYTSNNIKSPMIPIYDEFTQTTSTTSSSNHSIPVSSFTSGKTTINDEVAELREFLNSLQNYNKIRFSAYRTGMKLFAIQKWLCLDLVDISKLDKEFRALPAGIAQISWESLFNVLRHVYEFAHLIYPHILPNVQCSIRRCIELIRLLSPNFETRIVMLILIVLCNGKLDDKYRYLFLVYVTGNDNTATSTDLRELFSDLAKLPAFIQEDRIFGAWNVESTVRSCLNFNNGSNATSNSSTSASVLSGANRQTASIKSIDFWRWIRADPQTLIWIRVMHRLVRSEFSKHNVRCASCRMQPIVGIRFRCLHCFNVDLCQNCFFTQQPVKNHKNSHEMHEYYMQTSTLDNVRDFTQIMHNKMRRTRSSNKIGYTPIDLSMTLTLDDQLIEQTDKGEETRQAIEVNVDAVIDQARREGRLPPPVPPQRKPTPLTRWPNMNAQKPAALSSSASPEDLNRLILELKRENTALWRAFESRNKLNPDFLQPDSNDAVPPILRRFDATTRELAEAMNCLLTLANSTSSEI